nr:MAG TPA: minor tail protein [Caudoviricetes sp.]
MADHEVRISTRIDTSQMQRLQLQIDKATDKVENLRKKAREVGEQKIPSEEYQKLEAELKTAQEALEKLVAEEDNFVAAGLNMGSPWESLIQKEADAGLKIDELKEKMQKLVEDGRAFTSGMDTEQYQNLSQDLAYAERNLSALNTRQAELMQKQGYTAEGFEKAGKSAQKAFSTASNGVKKTNGLIGTLLQRLKGIALSLLVFNWITKGFNTMVSAMKEGFQNLARYSKDYNAQMSALKSSCSQFKNSLAAAFEPIVNMAIPYLVKLINWLIKAADAIAQFMAILQGKSTYTRAKKQNIDYAKSLDTTTKSAKKALAAFDELNVLSEQGGTTAGGGELTGKDAFEEASVNPKMVEMLEKAKKLMEIIKPLAIFIGFVLLAWRISGLLKDLEELSPYLIKAVGIVMLIAGAALMVYNYVKMWKNGVDWEGIVGYVAGLALAVVGLLILFGPIAAGIGLIVGGAAGLILALKDITENGINAQNMTLLLISAGAILAGVFITLGGAATVVVGAVMAVIAAIAGVVAWAGNGEEALATLQDMLGKLGDFVKNVFTGDWKSAFEAIVGFAKDAVNMGNIIVESFANGFIKAINFIIDAINSLSIDIPDWVPFGWGGKKWSPNIPNWNAQVSLPRLANGAVIQGGQPFLAWLGDQPRGQTNIETPLATMVEAFKQAQRENGGGTYTFVAKLNEREIFRETVRQDRMYKNTHGQSAFI